MRNAACEMHTECTRIAYGVHAAACATNKETASAPPFPDGLGGCGGDAVPAAAAAPLAAAGSTRTKGCATGAGASTEFGAGS